MKFKINPSSLLKLSTKNTYCKIIIDIEPILLLIAYCLTVWQRVIYPDTYLSFCNSNRIACIGWPLDSMTDTVYSWRSCRYFLFFSTQFRLIVTILTKYHTVFVYLLCDFFLYRYMRWNKSYVMSCHIWCYISLF